MLPIQPGILSALPLHARYLAYRQKPGTQPASVLAALARTVDGTQVVAGLGESLVLALNKSVPGLRTFNGMAGPGVLFPSTPLALWLWLRDNERGALIHAQRRFDSLLAPAFDRVTADEAFYYHQGRDLSGYEDGTENPKGDAIPAVVAINGRGPGLDGSSLVAVQHWIHDLNLLASMNPRSQDEIIGRRITDNAEMEDAPESAHVKRTAQESFHPEAFVWRRSMPWSDAARAGLIYVAFAGDFYAFEAQLKRMAGLEDGVIDGLFQFSLPVSCAYYWCPPVRQQGGLDLSALGIDHM
jgi:porphyrinogen peroxidase